MQVWIRNHHIAKWSKKSKVMLRNRKIAQFSLATTHLLNVCQKNIEKVKYRIPGINKNTPQYYNASQQEIILCSTNFTSSDCMMLSMLLRNSAASIKTLILDKVDGTHPSYEFDLLVAISKSTSLRSVVVVGGSYTSNFLLGLFNVIQVENPRIINLTVENVQSISSKKNVYHANMIDCCSRLLLDYFNYSLPGIQLLSLHNNHLTDEMVSQLANGLQVNTSLQTLCLSLNLITDSGLTYLLEKLVNNSASKSSLIRLDLSWNLIKMSDGRIHELMRNYHHPNLGYYLDLYLLHNMIYEFYDPLSDLLVRGNPPDINVIYTEQNYARNESLLPTLVLSNTNIQQFSRIKLKAKDVKKKNNDLICHNFVDNTGEYDVEKAQRYLRSQSLTVSDIYGKPSISVNNSQKHSNNNDNLVMLSSTQKLDLLLTKRAMIAKKAKDAHKLKAISKMQQTFLSTTSNTKTKLDANKYGKNSNSIN